MFELGKKKFCPPEWEAFIEDDGDMWQVSLCQYGVQVAGVSVPDPGDGSGLDYARKIAREWETGGVWGGARPI